MFQQNNSNDNGQDYWQGNGRKLIIVPNEVLIENVVENPLTKQLYITGMGFYPAANSHYTFREKGCQDLVVILCTSGKGTYETSEGIFSVFPGQFFILSAEEWHSYRADEKHPWSIYWICIRGSDVPKLCKTPALRNCFKPVYAHMLRELSKLFDDFFETLANGYNQKALNFCNLRLDFMIHLLLSGQEKMKEKKLSLSQQVIKFMEENLSERYQLPELAKRFNYSVSQFSYLFKKETTHSPIIYFIDMKLTYGAKLLVETDKKIFEVAQELGYPDQYHFSKLFKKIKHLSPEQYRAENGKQ